MAKKGQSKPVKSVKESKSNMKTSIQCEACNSKCEAGILYITKMSKPHSVGYGTTCKIK